MSADVGSSVLGDSSRSTEADEVTAETSVNVSQVAKQETRIVATAIENSQLFVIYNPLNKSADTVGLQDLSESNNEIQLTEHQLKSNLPQPLPRTNSVSLSDGIRLATVLFCLGWFIFNSYTILQEYTDHETIVYLDYQKPNISKPPAITICTHCVMCSLSSVEQLTVSTVLQTNDIWGIQHKSPNPKIVSEPSKDVQIECTFTRSTIIRQKGEQGDLNCVDLVDVVISMQEAHKCYTYFSDMDGNLSKQIKGKPQYLWHYDLQPSINLEVKGYFVMGQPTGFIKEVNKYGKPGPTYTGMYLSIHDPTILPDMYGLNFHVIATEVKTIFRFNKRVQKLQPPPYRTMCYDYKHKQTDQSEENSEMRNAKLSNYKSRGECFLFCMWKALNLDRCANLYSIFTAEMERKDNTVRLLKRLQNMALRQKKDRLEEEEDKLDSSDNVVDRIKFCAKANDSYDQYVLTKERCLQECPQSCEIETFSQEDAQYLKLTKRENTASVGSVSIRWATQPVVNIVHRPKLELTEFLGTLGGHAHIWLGLSVIHVIWFLIRLGRHFLPEANWCDVVQCWKFCLGRRRNVHM